MTAMTDDVVVPGAPGVRVLRVLREAGSVWRWAGVRGSDRRVLRAELLAELDGAAADGVPASAVVGDDVRVTARAWAQERDLAGRSLHAAWLVPVGLLAFSLGTVVLAAYLTTTMGGASPLPVEFAELGAVIVATGVVLGVGLPVLAVWAGLLSGGDPRARATALWLLVTLPVGQGCAYALAPRVPGWVGERFAAESVGPSVLAVMALALLAGRWLAVRRPSPDVEDRGVQEEELRVPPEWGA